MKSHLYLYLGFPDSELDKSVWYHNFLYDFVNNYEAIVNAMAALNLIYIRKHRASQEYVYPLVLSSEQLHFILQLLEFDFDLIMFVIMMMIY